MSEQVPNICRIVQYTLSEGDANEINRRRKHAIEHMIEHNDRANGVQLHVGNHVDAGDVFPMVIIRVWGDQPTSAVNGKVLLDGNDDFWATSRCGGEGPGHWAWPARV